MTPPGAEAPAKALMAMRKELVPHLFSDRSRTELASIVDIDPTRAISAFAEADPAELADVELLITGWYAPHIDAAVLDAMPRLKTIVHAAGAVGFIDPEAWERGITVSTAAAANAVPVAEFTVAMITLAGKDAFWVSRDYCARREPIDREAELPHIGNYGRVIGIVGASRIGSRVMEMLRAYDVRTLVFDPYCTPDRALELGAELVDDLHELASRSSILSIHAPSLPATWGMVVGEPFAHPVLARDLATMA